MSETEQKGTSDTSTDSWNKVIEETFAKEPEGWSYAATSRTPPLRFDAPGLVMTLPGGETSVAAYWCEKKPFGDVSITVTLVLLSAQEPTQSYCGISFRAKSDKDNYRLFLDGDGYFRLTRRVENVSHALVDWTQHSAIHSGPDQENRVRIVARGSEITVYVNGEKVHSLTDDTFATGHVALQAQGGSPETESATVFCFRNLEIAAP